MIESSRSREAFEEARLGPLKLRNRVIKAATFEGMTDGNTVRSELIEFHRRMAAGGVGMTTMAYIGVSPDGRGTPNELVPEARHEADLKRLADAVHQEGAALSGQIGHAGAVAASAGLRGLSPSRLFSPIALRRTQGLHFIRDLLRKESDDAGGELDVVLYQISVELVLGAELDLLPLTQLIKRLCRAELWRHGSVPYRAGLCRGVPYRAGLCRGV